MKLLFHFWFLQCFTQSAENVKNELFMNKGSCHHFNHKHEKQKTTISSLTIKWFHKEKQEKGFGRWDWCSESHRTCSHDFRFDDSRNISFQRYPTEKSIWRISTSVSSKHFISSTLLTPIQIRSSKRCPNSYLFKQGQHLFEICHRSIDWFENMKFSNYLPIRNIET